MTPLALFLIGNNERKGIFSSQSDLAKKIATHCGQYYPNVASIRPLISQVLAGNRKVPEKLSAAIYELLKDMSPLIISGAQKEIQNHNKFIVPERRMGRNPNPQHNQLEQNEICRALTRNQIYAELKNWPFGEVMDRFGSKCREANSEISDVTWRDLFIDLLREGAKTLP